MPDKDSTTSSPDPNDGERRVGERRKAQVPFEGADRRKGERRAGTDRRRTPRSDRLE